MANPLKVVEPRRVEMSPQDWCDRGNALLAGQIPFEHDSMNGKQKFAGTYQSPPRHDVHWFLLNGRPTIGWR
jgi:hypothetical protein